MKVIFRYGRFDKRVWWVSTLAALLFGLLVAYLFWSAGGAYYLAVWVTVVGIALGALMVLSVPRKILVGEEEVELRCLVETTYVPLGSIVDVEILEGEGLRGKWPLCGSYGFWGYYGFYVDPKRWRLHRVYAKRRDRCVAIHTSKRRYVVSCNAPELLRTMILSAKQRAAREE